ncbi:replication initiator [Dactylosporangium sp. NPDC048998]|uniref:replication initiator n=1 Tax=Dactylosporangium sp. NPDC048998 TaxID=3363976 RepID=UPI0037146617
MPALREAGSPTAQGPDPRRLAPHRRTRPRARTCHRGTAGTDQPPRPPRTRPRPAVRESQWDQVDEVDDAIREVEETIAAEGLRGSVAPAHDKPTEPKRQRSTKRRQDAPALPRQKVDPRTIGRVYTAPDGTEYRPSMWLTVTLDSYGPVRPDGSPVDPATYDYRRAAWDAIAFPRLLDRFWQNLRRCVGWNVQYAGCVEPQRRLAPHAHFAIRGTIPRAVLREVAAATYHQVWWPKVDAPTCRPVWNADAETWCDGETGLPLTSWDEALDAIEDEPTHVIRFGAQIRAEGVTADDKNVDRTIGYITTSPSQRPTATPRPPTGNATT